MSTSTTSTPNRGDDVFGLWDRTSQPGPIHLDHQRLAFDAECEAAAVTDLSEPAGQDLCREDAQPHVLDSKLSVRELTVVGHAHTRDLTSP